MSGNWGKATGTGGTWYDSDSKQYPGVPYGPNDFTPRNKCPSGSGQIENYNVGGLFVSK